MAQGVEPQKLNSANPRLAFLVKHTSHTAKQSSIRCFSFDIPLLEKKENCLSLELAMFFFFV